MFETEPYIQRPKRVPPMLRARHPRHPRTQTAILHLIRTRRRGCLGFLANSQDPQDEPTANRFIRTTLGPKYRGWGYFGPTGKAYTRYSSLSA
jgi:hypothetical protein